MVKGKIKANKKNTQGNPLSIMKNFGVQLK